MKSRFSLGGLTAYDYYEIIYVPIVVCFVIFCVVKKTEIAAQVIH